LKAITQSNVVGIREEQLSQVRVKSTHLIQAAGVPTLKIWMAVPAA
jgi:hypothetical protein